MSFDSYFIITRAMVDKHGNRQVEIVNNKQYATHEEAESAFEKESQRFGKDDLSISLFFIDMPPIKHKISPNVVKALSDLMSGNHFV